MSDIIKICAKCGRKVWPEFDRNISFDLVAILERALPNYEVKLSECMDLCESNQITTGIERGGETKTFGTPVDRNLIKMIDSIQAKLKSDYGIE